MKKIQKYTSLLFWGVVFIILALFLQKKGEFHFFYIEQWNLFLYDRLYITSTLLQPGGLCRLLANFGIQYFIHPHAGAIISAVIFVAIGILCSLIFKKLTSKRFYIISLLPVISLLYMHLNISYSYSGTIAYAIMLGFIYIHLLFKSTNIRFIYDLIATIVLFGIGGPVALLYGIVVFLIEIFQNIRKCYLFLFPIALTLFLALLGMRYAWAGEYRFILSPEGYFAFDLKPGNAIYISWFCLPISMIAAILFAKIPNKKILNILSLGIQVIALGCFMFGIKSFFTSSQENYKELDYYMRTEQWDSVLQRCRTMNMNNFLYHCFANVALAEKGELAEHLFEYPQRGLQSIYPSWDRTPHVSLLLNDAYFSMGLIAFSQRIAFEANIRASNRNPRLLKRLVQTNLIMGAYPVAEKYISILEKTHYYKEWATQQRRFLNNDEAIEKDPLLGNKRKCITSDRFIAKNGVDKDLIDIAKANPNHRATIQYVGAIYLLIKDLDSFKNILDFYGTDILPELPKSFAEAVFLYGDENPATWEKYNIKENLIKQHSNYKTPGSYWNYYFYMPVQ